MSGNSTGILSQVATSMMNFGAPMLLDEKDWEEAERMADAGLLQRHDPVFKSFGYSLTDAGIEAYNKAFPPAPLPDPVKVWGEQPPKSLKGRIAFIKRQCVKPLEDAYWLEARLKYREKDGKLTFWYELIRPDRVFKTAVTDELGRIKEATGFPVVSGKP